MGVGGNAAFVSEYIVTLYFYISEGNNCTFLQHINFVTLQIQIIIYYYRLSFPTVHKVIKTSSLAILLLKN